MRTDMGNKLPYTTIRADIAHALRFGPLSVAQHLVGWMNIADMEGGAV